MNALEQERYPVGRMPRLDAPVDAKTRAENVATLVGLPGQLRGMVTGLSDAQLDTAYRDGGWTIRQVVHHIADSHMNAYIRMKLAATEDEPAVKTYEEKDWAALPEARSAPVGMSLDLIDGLHRRWMAFLEALPEAELRRGFRHPEWGTVTIEESIGMYAWHCRHHTAHIAAALKRR
jgi:uncharacterized damage-inducible protein DinB